jgi:hypothetical protein
MSSAVASWRGRRLLRDALGIARGLFSWGRRMLSTGRTSPLGNRTRTWLRVRMVASVALLLVVAACGGDSSPTGPSTTVIPAAPALLASSLTHAVSLYWPCVANATGYKVSRDGTAIATVTACNYVDLGLAYNTQHCYTVHAFSPAGTSGESNQVCAKGGSDYSGNWTGTTSQDRSISFVASGGDTGNLTGILYSIRAEGRVGWRYCWTEPSWCGTGASTRIENATFKHRAITSDGTVELAINGEFTSETAVSGKISAHVISGPCTGLFGSVDWTAERR